MDTRRLLVPLIALVAVFGASCAALLAGEGAPAEAPPAKGKGRLPIKLGPGNAAIVGINTRGEAAVGDCFAVFRAGRLIGYVQATEMLEKVWPKIGALAGDPRVGDELVALAAPMMPVELLTDEPDGREAKELKALCGARLTIEPFGDKMRVPAQPDEALIVMIHGGVPFMMGDPIVRPYARRGGMVIADTLAYSRLDQKEADEAKFTEPPTLRIIGEGKLTAGIPPESRIPWYGTRGKAYYARYIGGLPEPNGPKLIATDHSTNNTAILEEDLGGRLLMLDLITPSGRAGRDPGSKNKLIFVARALGSGPRYARYMPSRPEFDDLMGWFDTLAENYKDRLVKAFEGGSDRRETYIYSYTIGEKSKPLIVLAGCMEGTDWLAATSLLRLAEVLIENPEGDPAIEWLMPRVRIRIIPVVNVMGYRANTAADPSGVDLDRNFPYHWEEFADKKARGREPLCEAGPAILKRGIEDEKAIGFLELDVDTYEHGYRIVRSREASEPHQALLRTLVTVTNARLLRRFVVDGDKMLQLRLTRDAERPSAINWAGTKGTLAASLKICGDGEDSLTNNDVAIEGALHFLYLTALSLEKPDPLPEPPEKPKK